MNQKHTVRRALALVALVVAVVLLAAKGWTTATAEASGTPMGDDDRRAYGRIDSFPSGLIGLWIINGVTYEANGNSEFQVEVGPFSVGKCVKVRYFDTQTPFLIDEVETENDSDCGGGRSTPGASATSVSSSTPHGTSTPDSSSTPSVTATPIPSITSSSTPEGDGELSGFVDSMPSLGLVGTWRINGVDYVANASTEFEQKEGPFVVGACVEVEFFNSSPPYVIDEIETEELDDCSRHARPTPAGTPSSTVTPEGSTTPTGTASPSPTGTDGAPSGELELFGLLQSFPSGFVGNWNIGGMTFVASTNTEFEQENGPFAIGSTVKVHFSVQNGVNVAREIETKFANDIGGNDDDGNGSFEGSEGHVFSIIDHLSGVPGTWTIGQINYVVNKLTNLDETKGSIDVGKQVKVAYYLDANQNRVAQKIETTSEDGGVDGAGNFKLFGFVSQMPPSNFTGTWVVDNVAFSADSGTQFTENNGLLGLGSFVALEYFIADGRNQIHEIETHVPPGAGDNQVAGEVQSMGTGVAAASTDASMATWVIGGRSYVVNPATDLNEANGVLAVGATAVVNSYTAEGRGEVATQIRSVVLTDKAMLPLIIR